MSGDKKITTVSDKAVQIFNFADNLYMDEQYVGMGGIGK